MKYENLITSCYHPQSECYLVKASDIIHFAQKALKEDTGYTFELEFDCNCDDEAIDISIKYLNDLSYEILYKLQQAGYKIDDPVALSVQIMQRINGGYETRMEYGGYNGRDEMLVWVYTAPYQSMLPKLEKVLEIALEGTREETIQSLYQLIKSCKNDVPTGNLERF